MKLVCESEKLDEYVNELEEVNYSQPVIQEKAVALFSTTQSDIEKVKVAFEFVRDEIAHSWDIQGSRVTCDAAEVLTVGEGICYAKSNLLAALLRSQGIPTGFCYQRLMLFDTPEKGYSLHALNAVYIQSIQKWIRLDARGNKTGINAQFSLDEEKLAFTINEAMDEIDYPIIFTKPNAKTLSVLKQSTNATQMYKHFLPESL